MPTGPRDVRATGCTVDIRPLAEVDDALAADWAALGPRAAEANVFFEAAFVRAAARHLPGGADVQLLTVRRGDELVLALPLRDERHRRVPLRVWSSWRHPYRYLGTPLVAPSALLDAPLAALSALAGHGPGWMVLESLAVDGPVARAFRSAAAATGASWTEYDHTVRPVVHAREDDTYLADTMSARSLKTLRRLRRNLGRDVGEPVLTTDAARSGRAGLDEEVSAFLTLEAAGWKGRSGTAMASRPADAAFFRQVCRDYAADDRLELWRTSAGGTVAARQCHLVSGSTVFHFKTTYDEGYARYSPGVQLELDVLRAFHEDPRLQLLDPCTEDEETVSHRLYPDQRRLGIALVGLTPTGRLAARATPLAARVWRAMRR